MMTLGTKMDIFVQTLDLMRFRNGTGFRGNNNNMGVTIVLLILIRHLGHYHQHYHYLTRGRSLSCFRYMFSVFLCRLAGLYYYHMSTILGYSNTFVMIGVR
jgi:hypothetical protein